MFLYLRGASLKTLHLLSGIFHGIRDVCFHIGETAGSLADTLKNIVEGLKLFLEIRVLFQHGVEGGLDLLQLI